MKVGIFALCCLVASAAAFKYDTNVQIPKVVNQQFIDLVLRHNSQPLIIDEYRQFVDKPVLEPTRYVSLDIFHERIYRFFDLYEHGLVLPRGRVGTFFDQKFVEQTGLLFNIFYYSIDLPTLFENIIWARENVNELMFIHALHLAVFHRVDLKDIVLPPLYEILPHHFFTYDVLKKGIDYKMAGLDKINSTFTVYTDYTSRFYLDKFNEQRLAYFTEDIGLNSFYYYFYMQYPMFLGGRYNSVDMKVFNLDKEPVGELWFYMHQQLLARYYLERISNDLGQIRDITWIKGIKTGYWPMLRYKNGLEFSYRSNYYGSESMDKKMLDIVYDWETRIRDMIDSGYITLGEKKYSINDPHFLDILGNLMLGNVEETRFYRYVLVFYHLLAGGHGAVKMDSYFYAPSVLEHFETVLRDPVFYQMYQRIIQFWLQYKDQLHTYKTEDLYVPVKIDDVIVSPLKTYFEYEQVDVTNVVDIDIVEPKLDYTFLVRQPRLNYEPFDVKLLLDAETAGDYTVRFFLGPKVLNRYNLNELRQYFFELDHFIAPLTSGKNTIVRKSREFLYFFRDLVKYHGGQGEIDYDIVNKYLVEYGFPARLLLPKGKVGGMPFTFYVIVHKNDDQQQLGFPFDRKIDVLNFFVPNMYFKDVIISQIVDYDIFSPMPLNNIFYKDVIPMHSIRVPLNVEYYKDNELNKYFWHFNDVYRVWYQKYFPNYYKPTYTGKSLMYDQEYKFQYPVGEKYTYGKTFPTGYKTYPTGYKTYGKTFDKTYTTKYEKPFFYNYVKDFPYTYEKDYQTTYQKDLPFTYKKGFQSMKNYPYTYEKDYPTTYEKEIPTMYKKNYPYTYQKDFPINYEKTYTSTYEKPYIYEKNFPITYEKDYPTTYKKTFPYTFEKDMPTTYMKDLPFTYKKGFPYMKTYPYTQEKEYNYQPYSYEKSYPIKY